MLYVANADVRLELKMYQTIR